MKCAGGNLALLLGVALLASSGCKDKNNKGAETLAQAEPAGASPAPASEESAQVIPPAAVGKSAPNFTLADLGGKRVSLAEFKGKTVVLEWFNPECPFVKAAHTKGSLRDMAKQHAGKSEVVWLAVNSGAAGRQGHGVDTNKAGVESFGLEHPVLIDESGAVGKAYGATNTPHMFVIDKGGTLVYSGAIDNSPDGEGESPTGDELINYVGQALEELGQNKPVSVPKTKAYGCSVKYAS
jgi:peroxiredoxin